MTTIAISLRFILLSTLLFSFYAHAEFDVDDADSLDFGSFHKKIPASHSPSNNDKKEQKLTEKKPELINPTRNLESSQRYSLTRSDITPYSAFYVIEAMHQAMAKQCPKGWVKQKEWSTHAEAQDYYLHYEYSCIE